MRIFLWIAYSTVRNCRAFNGLFFFLNISHCLLRRWWTTVWPLLAITIFLQRGFAGWSLIHSLLAAGFYTVLNVLFCRALTQASLAWWNCCPKIQIKNSFQESSQVILLLERSCLALPYKMRSQTLVHVSCPKSTLHFRSVQRVYLIVHVMRVCSLRKTPFHSWNCETNRILSWNTCIGRLTQQL